MLKIAKPSLTYAEWQDVRQTLSDIAADCPAGRLIFH